MKPVLCAALLATVALAEARAVDVSGVYENFGSMVAAGAEAADGAISLQGLCNLDFDYGAHRALHADTDRVVITQTDLIFRIECKTSDGNVVWSGQWSQGIGYRADDRQVELVFHSRRLAQDYFGFTLRTVGDQNLLLIEVQRVNSTYFGPVAKPIGSFLFSRLPRK